MNWQERAEKTAHRIALLLNQRPDDPWVSKYMGAVEDEVVSALSQVWNEAVEEAAKAAETESRNSDNCRCFKLIRALKEK